MPKLAWGTVGRRFYEAGVDRGVLYVGNDPGVAWSGLVSMDESPSGGEAKAYYFDGIKYLNLSAKEEFEGDISAFYSPPEFDACDGLGVVRPGLFASQQPRKSFGLSYRTKIGNDVDGENHAYKIHIIYNALAAPTQRTHASIDDGAGAPLLAWSITTKPVLISGVGYSSHLIVDTTTATSYSIQTLEDILYGTDVLVPRLPTAVEMVALFTDSTPLVVTDVGVNKFTITGSGLAVWMIDADQYQITSNTVIIYETGTAQISSE